MKREFKPGDLVLIVGADTDTKNIGKSAELVELVSPFSFSDFVLPNGLRASHEDAQPCWLLAGDSLVQDDSDFNGFAMRHPRWLIPLHGDDAPDAALTTERPTELVSA